MPKWFAQEQAWRRVEDFKGLIITGVVIFGSSFHNAEKFAVFDLRDSHATTTTNFCVLFSGNAQRTAFIPVRWQGSNISGWITNIANDCAISGGK
ncbi:hypothetical protein TNCV_2052381 [Trichonephila clavipes]|nr:hypothetical protein TNCV_2052381 [Trichonephila clavipes]